METEGLSIICAGLGFAEEEGGTLTRYSKSEYCLDNLKDLQRFLRRDDPQGRPVFKQICKWNTVSRDLIPIIEHYQSDRNLVINAVKVLVFLTMPIDPTSDDIAQQIEYLWDLKAAMTRNIMIAVVVSLLEDPLEHLERDAFTEDDWKLVQLVLTLFRNLLAIQEISLQQKASGSATQFLCLRERFLELLFNENVMDLILVLIQHVDGSNGYLHQDNLLLLEILHYIFQGQEPELIAKASKKGSKVNGDITTSLDSLRSIMEEEEEKNKFIRLRNLERHSQFSGTFTRFSMDGSVTLFKGNPASALGDGLLKVHKVPRGPLKRIAWEHGSLSIPKENISELLYNFLNQFLSGGYNVLMQSVREDISKEHHAVQNTDVVVFFEVAHFILAFQHQKVSISKELNVDDATHDDPFDHELDDLSFHGNICGPVAETMNQAMFYLVISKWRGAFEGLKETNDHKTLSATGSLMKSMIRMLDLVLKLLPEDSKEPQTARVLLYKIFYDQTDQGLTQFLLNLFKSFDTHKQPKSDLAGLLEIIHIMLRLMEKLQARGTLRVSKKSRKGRKKKISRGSNEVEAERLAADASPRNDDDLNHATGGPASETFLDSDKLIKENLTNSTNSNSVEREEGTSIPDQTEEPDMPPVVTGHLRDDMCQMDNDKVSNNLTDLEDGIIDSSNDDLPPATNEVDFNISRLVACFATNAVIQNLCWLLKYYKSNSVSTNHYIICMLRRISDDLELSPMLYQLSLLTTFYDILADHKTSKSKEYKNIVQFLTNFIRKMLKMLKSQPLLFVEILFWKTRKECHDINAEALMRDLGNLKKEVRKWDAEGEIGLSKDRGQGIKNIADSLGEDEVDFMIPHELNNEREESPSDGTHQNDLHRTKQSVGEKNSSESSLNNEFDKEKKFNLSNHHNEDSSSEVQPQRAPRRQKGPVFDQEQETTIKILYEQIARRKISNPGYFSRFISTSRYKDDRQCSRLIAEALDPDGKISPVQVSNKLKKLGLKIFSRKKLRHTDMPIPAGDDQTGVKGKAFNDACPDSSNEPEDNSFLKTSFHTRKRIRVFSKEQELEVKLLYERFKNHKKCSHLIANALGADNTYSAAQVSCKLKQLGLLAPLEKRLAKAAKDFGEKETIDRGEESDEEPLIALIERSKRKRKTSSQGATVITISQHKVTSLDEHDSHDNILSSSLEGVIAECEPDLFHTGRHEAVDFGVSDDKLEDELDNGGNREQDEGEAILGDQDAQVQRSDDELMEEFIDSGDDVGPVAPRRMGFRRNLKMVIDVEDDD